jgi:anti-anti-sigma regulatory factor
VVFSFFKKDPKDGKDGSRGAAKASPRTPPKPMGKPMPDPAVRNGAGGLPNSKFATTENAIPRELARSLALETAAKIDAIESEMARDFLRPAANTGSPAADPTTRGRATGGAGAGVPPAPAARPPSVNKKAEKADVEVEDDTLEGSSDLLLGSLNAIELSSSGAGSVIDETAILFANGQAAEAEETLRQGLESESVGAASQTAWHMLFELVNQRSDKASFEQLTMQYALRFENSPPAWMDYAAAGRPAIVELPVAAAPAPAPVQEPAPAASMLPSGLPIIALPADVDANVVKALELLKNMAAQHSALAIDASQVRSVDLVGAELLLRVVNAFKRSSHELSILGCEQLQVPLRSAVEPGRRDASDAAWMLLLEVLRLLDKQHDFEETGIQYCITFEVSPPSWEPPPPNLKSGPAPARPVAPAPAAAPAPVPASAALAAAAAATAPAVGPLDWRGVVDGEGEPQFGRMVAEARSSKHLQIECRYLQRMGFSAASALLTHVMKLQSGGVRVEFRNVNPLVVALLTLLGVSAVANVQPRRP